MELRSGMFTEEYRIDSRKTRQFPSKKNVWMWTVTILENKVKVVLKEHERNKSPGKERIPVQLFQVPDSESIKALKIISNYGKENNTHRLEK